MSNLNSWTATGRLTADPNLKYLDSGTAILNFNLAVQRDKDNCDFIPCVAWQKQAESLANLLSKGSLISVKGRLQSRTYQTQDGQKRTVIECHIDPFGVGLLGSKKNDGDGGGVGTEPAGGGGYFDDGDDVPFSPHRG